MNEHYVPAVVMISENKTGSHLLTKSLKTAHSLLGKHYLQTRQKYVLPVLILLTHFCHLLEYLLRVKAFVNSLCPLKQTKDSFLA